MLCAATFSNSYVKWRLRYVMLRFVAVPHYLSRDTVPLRRLRRWINWSMSVNCTNRGGKYNHCCVLTKLRTIVTLCINLAAGSKKIHVIFEEYNIMESFYCTYGRIRTSWKWCDWKGGLGNMGIHWVGRSWRSTFIYTLYGIIDSDKEPKHMPEQWTVHTPKKIFWSKWIFLYILFE